MGKAEKILPPVPDFGKKEFFLLFHFMVVERKRVRVWFFEEYFKRKSFFNLSFKMGVV